MSAKINIAKIRNNVGAEEKFSFDVGSDEVSLPGWRILEPIKVEGTVTNKDGHLLLKGRILGELLGSCVRCLADVTEKLDISFEEKLLYQADTGRFSDLAFGELEEEYTVYDGDVFDFTDLLAENIFASLPSKVLCREDCLGLCPHCGHNLNEGQCDCVFEDIDPRLAILTKLTYSD